MIITIFLPLLCSYVVYFCREFKIMLRLHIFTDGSVNTKSKVGYGAYFVVSNLHISLESLENLIKLRRFEQTNSTKLELQMVLFALSETIMLINNDDITLTIYTDSQNTIGLPRRRTHLEQSNYFSRRNTRLNNYELYQTFYKLTSETNCEFVKVTGHQAFSKKDQIDKLFSLVDQASRRALRNNFHPPM